VFDLQRSLFVLNMKNNAKLVMQKPFDINLLTKLKWTLFSSRIFEQKIYEYIRLDELVVMHVISLVEDEQCYFTLIFMKIKLTNR
jgi:hypothetical protein